MRSGFLGFVYCTNTVSQWLIRYENFKQETALKAGSSDKIVATNGFVKIQRPISAFDVSIIILFGWPY